MWLEQCGSLCNALHMHIKLNSSGTVVVLIMKMLLKLVACIALLVSNTAAQIGNESELSLCVCI